MTAENASNLTAANVGLSEADLVAYRKRRAQWRRWTCITNQQPLDRQLQRQLEQFQQPSAKPTKEEMDAAIAALESAMLHNLQTADALPQTH